MRKGFGIVVLSLLIVAVSAVAYFPLTQPPSNPARVSWQEAITVLYTGQVTMVFQSHHLDVSLWLKNGTVITTKEPTIDAIGYEIGKCGDPCKNIVYGTE
jgi:hypothetical protein